MPENTAEEGTVDNLVTAKISNIPRVCVLDLFSFRN